MAQHVRRILWRFGDTEVDPFVFITTRVNYGNRPAECIAIAPAWEMAERFRKGKEEAAWFLKNISGRCYRKRQQQRERHAGICSHGEHNDERKWRFSVHGNCHVR